MSRRTSGFLVAGLVATTAVLLLLGDPRSPGRAPSCPVHALTGLHCPGCGSLRALACLARGELGAAVAYNAAFVAVLTFAMGRCLGRVAGSGASRRWSTRVVSPSAPVVLALLACWTVLRNLPVSPFSTLAP